MDNSVKKERNSNLELYRIIVMISIVAHHYVVNSGLTASDGPIITNPLAFKSLFLLVFGMWGKTGINCFVLITSYFMCKSKITVSKFLKLLLEIYVYKVVIYLIFFITGYTAFSAVSFVKMICPIVNVSNDFTYCFLIFYLLLPFLTLLIENMTERQHLYLLSICIFAYTVIGTIPSFGTTFNYVSWFCILFFIASYLRLYPKKWFSSKKIWGILTIASIVVSVASVIFMTFIEHRFGKTDLHYWFVSDSNKIFALSTAVTSFMFFGNLNIKNNKIINTIAASTFGVLLIHANSDSMRQWLWKDTLNNVGMYNTEMLYVHAILSVLGVFCVCAIIDIIRIKIIEKPIMKKINSSKWMTKYKI